MILRECSVIDAYDYCSVQSAALLFFSLKSFEDHVRAHIDVAAAEGDDEVILLRVVHDILGDILEGVNADAAFDLRAEVGVVDIVGVGFANRQDLRNDRDVRDAQRLREVVEQERGAGEGVRLEDRPDLAEAHLHRGAQCCGQLCGMMREVVGYRDALRRAEDLKAAVYAGELAEILRDLRGLCAEIMRAGCGGESVVDIMSAGDLQVDLAEQLALVHQVELFIRALAVSEVHGVVVVGFSEAEGDHRELYVFDRVEDVLVIAVVDDKPRGQVTELVEALFDIVERFEVVEMICVDVGDDGDIRIQLEEGIDIFARLADDDIALTDIAVAAEERQLAADDRGGIEARSDQRLAEHSGGRGLAVGTRDRDGAVVAAGDDTEHHRALDGGDAFFFSRNKLGVILLDGGGVDDQLSAFNVFSLMTHKYRDAVRADAVESLALIRVGAGELKALAVQDLCERAHSRAADADKMDPFDII